MGHQEPVGNGKIPISSFLFKGIIMEMRALIKEALHSLIHEFMHTMTYTEIKEKIMHLLNTPYGGSHYFTVEGMDGEPIKIRVSDHSANRHNNKGEKTLSFISARCNQGYKAMMDEWVIDKDGYSDTYQTIEEILEWNDVKDGE
jgi:hypothetical protein